MSQLATLSSSGNGNRHDSVSAPHFDFPDDNPSQLQELTNEELAAKANSHHRQYIKLSSDAVKYHARFAGEALLAVKARLPHGEFLGWIKKNFKGSAYTAQVYMRIARNWGKLLNRGFDTAITLEDMRRFLAKKKPKSAGADVGQQNQPAKEEEAAAGKNSKLATSNSSRKRKDSPPPQEAESPTEFPAPFSLTQEEAMEFDELILWLRGNVYFEATVTSIVMTALRFTKEAME